MLGPNFPELVYNELGRSPGPGTGPAPGSRPPEHESLGLVLVRAALGLISASLGKSWAPAWPGHTGRGYLLVSSHSVVAWTSRGGDVHEISRGHCKDREIFDLVINGDFNVVEIIVDEDCK